MSRIITDVLVVGGGGAACRAAIEAAQAGAKVAMIIKGKLGHCGATAFKASDLAAFNAADGQVDPEDSPAEHYGDIMKAAEGMAIPELARLMAENAPDAVESLEAWGVPFKMDGDHYLEYRSCFASRPRSHVIVGHGEPVMNALIPVIKNLGVTLYEDAMITDLLVEDGTCYGAVMLDADRTLKPVYAKAVILATGGAGRAFALNMNPPDVTGDGYAMAYRAGVKLINMEFMQAGLGIIKPCISLMTAYMWSGLPKLTNALGEDFLTKDLPEGVTPEKVMQDHAKHFPFSTSDKSFYLEELIQKQVQEGKGTEYEAVYMDMTHMTDEYVNGLDDEDLRTMWPISRDHLYDVGVDVLKEKTHLACFAHAINGGVLIDKNAESNIKGLYAAGETAGGPHGANRLGGNMIPTCQVFGKISGRAAAAYAAEIPQYLPETDAAETCAERAETLLYKDVDVKALKEELAVHNQRFLLIRRTEEGLESVKAKVDALREVLYNAPLKSDPEPENLILDNLLTATELMCTVALERKESRGAHYRADYPQRNDEAFEVPFVIEKQDGTMTVKRYENE